jgi:hypothetical protein
MHPNDRLSGAHEASLTQLRCHAIVKHAPTRGGLHVSVHMQHAAINFPYQPSCRALQFGYPVSVWQAEEAVANLPLRLAVRAHCSQPRSTGF